MSKHAGGRPRKYNAEQVNEICEKFKKYIEDNTIPIICEFASLNDLISQQLYDYPEFSTLLKKCTDKKQANLEKGALSNKINTTMAIFSLKQIGWSDKKEIEHSGSVQNDIYTMTREERQKRIEELEKKRVD